MHTYIPYNQLRTNSIIQYHQSQEPRRNTMSYEERNWKASIMANYHDITQEKTYTGTVTKGAKKRIQKAVSILVQGSNEQWIQNPVTGKRQKFKLSFITLTISETERNLTAKEAHKILLEPFLRYMRDRYNMRTYIWKAELQERGQIHYHLTTNVFIPYYVIRDYWNKLQRKAGLLENFKAKFGHENPNSIDVHSVYKIKNLESYLVKYLSKSESDKGSTEGKIWDCSTNIKRAKYFVVENDTVSDEKIKEAAKKGKVIYKETEHCKIIIPHKIKVTDLLTVEALQKYEIWRQELNLNGYSIEVQKE